MRTSGLIAVLACAAVPSASQTVEVAPARAAAIGASAAAVPFAGIPVSAGLSLGLSLPRPAAWPGNAARVRAAAARPGASPAARIRALVSASRPNTGRALVSSLSRVMAEQGRNPGMETLKAMWEGSRISGRGAAGVSPAGAEIAGGRGSIALGRPPRVALRRAAPVIAFASAALFCGPALGAAGAFASLSLGKLSLAFLAGIMAFLSPCVLPLIPAYVSFISGLSHRELTEGVGRAVLLKKAGLGSLAFVLGFTSAFTALGATATLLGAFLVENLPWVSAVAGGFVVLFGLHMMEIITIPWLYRDKHIDSGKLKPGIAGAFLMGMAFAFGWTPCVGPMLSGILALASSQATVLSGMALLSSFSMGLGIPFILTALSVNTFLHFFSRYKRFIGWGEKLAGALLVLLGVLLIFNKMDVLLQYVPEFFYRFAK
jgi:cytochrome c-type biogenesis protein